MYDLRDYSVLVDHMCLSMVILIKIFII